MSLKLNLNGGRMAEILSTRPAISSNVFTGQCDDNIDWSICWQWLVNNLVNMMNV